MQDLEKVVLVLFGELDVGDSPAIANRRCLGGSLFAGVKSSIPQDVTAAGRCICLTIGHKDIETSKWRVLVSQVWM